MLSGSALASRDRARATELLNEAESFAVKARPASARARSLLKIVSSFSAFDSVRGFEVMQVAVKAINEISVQQAESDRASKATATRTDAASGDAKSREIIRLDEIRDSAFEDTLARLARTDFERALLLAQQLDGKETSVAAQLAVCRGGLAIEPQKERSQTEAEELVSGVNH